MQNLADIGSRCYVTAKNAGRIYFLAEAIVSFLQRLQKLKNLNQLETTKMSTRQLYPKDVETGWLIVSVHLL